MERNNDKFIIEGVRCDGQKFRPSDWIERISTTMASFGRDHRLKYAQCVQPMVLDGNKCLVVDRIFEQKDPLGYQYIMDFAKTNDLRICEYDGQEGAVIACSCPLPG